MTICGVPVPIGQPGLAHHAVKEFRGLVLSFRGFGAEVSRGSKRGEYVGVEVQPPIQQ